jgi:hypothetical protein
VYEFTLAYDGSCEGFTDGELRVDGSTVELWGNDGGELQKIGEGVREPDDSFTLNVPEAGFAMHGQFADNAVEGTGTFAFAGNSCGFTFHGNVPSPRAPIPKETTTTTTEPESAELDPTGDRSLTDAEIRGVLHRLGMKGPQIDKFFEGLEDHLATSHTTDSLEKERSLVVMFELAHLERTEGDPGFPILSTLVQQSTCDDCIGPLIKLADGVRANEIPAATLNRAVRLALTMDLP